MNTCPRCDEPLPENTKQCKYCGCRINPDWVVRESNPVPKKGIKRLFASIMEEFTPNLFETFIFFVALNIPILDMVLTILLWSNKNAPPIKKTVTIAWFIFECITIAVSVVYTFFKSDGDILYTILNTL